MNFLIPILAVLLALPALAQEEGAYFEVSNLYHERARTFACDFVKAQVEEIKAKRADEILKEIESQEAEVAKELKSADGETRADLEKLSVALQVSRRGDSKSILVSGLESICKGARAPIQGAARVVSIMNSAAINTVAMPFSGLFSFLKGTLGRRNKTELGPRTDFIYRMMGPKRGAGSYMLGSLAYHAPDLVLGFSAAWGIVNVSVMIEMITNYQCAHVNQYNKKKVEFCKDYGELKDFLHKGNSWAFNAGKNLQRLLDKRIIAKREKLHPETFCTLNREEQVRRTRKALNRADYFKADSRVAAAEVLLPIQKNTCTRVLVRAKGDDLPALKTERPAIEGIEIVYLNQTEFAGDYYYSNEELDEMSLEEQLCHDVEVQTYTKKAMNGLAVMGEGLKASLAPSMLSVPSHEKLIISDKDFLRGSVAGLKNMIFSIGPKPEDAELVENYKKERKEITKKVKSTYKSLIKSQTFTSCRALVDKKNIDIKVLAADFGRLSAINNSDAMKKDLEFSLVKKAVKKLRRKLKLDWELIPTNDLNEILGALASKDVGNVIVLSHGKSSGHLVDVMDQELPREAFTGISPTIMSLGFYSCHSQKLVDLYGLKKIFQNQKGNYKQRYLTTVAENSFMESSNFAPIAAFENYLFETDRFLSAGMKGAQLLQDTFGPELPLQSEEMMCSMNLDGVQVKKGSYAVILNDKMVALQRADSEGDASFPCAYLKTGSNTLKVKNIISSGGSEFESIPEMKITVEGRTLTSSDMALKLNSMVSFRFSR